MQIGAEMATKNPRKAVALPAGTKRKGGLVLGTKARAAAVDRSGRARVKMYALIEKHPGSEEEIQQRVMALRPISAVKAKKVKQRKGRMRTVEARVSSPTVAGAVETLQRTVDPLEVMFKANQLSKRQWRAINEYRDAREVVYGQVGGSMDFERVRGAGSPGSPPIPAYMDACETLRTAKLKLYPLDHTILTLVLVGTSGEQGMSFKQCAEQLSARVAGWNERRIGERFKVALGVLADELWGEEKAGDAARIRSYLQPGARPTEATAEVVPRAVAAHADGRRVVRTGG